MKRPVREIVDRAHKVGAIAIVDGAQSVPHMKTDVQALDCDFFVFSGHKMLGSTGTGVVYGKKALLEEMEPFLLGGDMIEYVQEQTTTFNDLPYKFEAGSQNVEGAVALHAAIDYLEAIGMDNVEKHEEELTKRCLEGMLKLPHIHILGSTDETEKTGVISFTIDGVHPHDAATILDSYGIAIRSGHHCAQPLGAHLHVEASNRASFYIYNTLEEVDYFLSKLPDPHNLQEHGHNPSCGDDITLQADIENGIIKDAAYTGHGCAISQASTDIMIDLIKGKSVKEALRLVNLFLAMIKREETDDSKLEELDDAIALKNISNMPARVKCAVLAWHTLKDALEEQEKK